MNFDKKSILAFLLIGLVFLLVQTPIYKKYFFPQVYQQEQMRNALQDSLRLAPAAPKAQPFDNKEPMAYSANAATADQLDLEKIYHRPWRRRTDGGRSIAGKPGPFFYHP